LPNAIVRQGGGDGPKGNDGLGGSGVAQTRAARLDTGDPVESIPHVVARGENFFSIAQQYYGSGRFYRALWKANSDQVPAPEKLRVGQTIRIPPPEALDRSLILPPRTAQGPGPGAGAEAAGTTTTQPVRTGARSSGVALAVPVADPFGDRDRPGGKTAAGALVAAPAPSAADRPRLPRYRIRPQESLRSIARDVLGDSRRADEILELNRAVIDDPGHLIPGQEIELPEDARLTRRSRSEP
jgi:nucleoid-associated protein YgaU